MGWDETFSIAFETMSGGREPFLKGERMCKYKMVRYSFTGQHSHHIIMQAQTFSSEEKKKGGSYCVFRLTYLETCSFELYLFCTIHSLLLHALPVSSTDKVINGVLVVDWI